VGPWGAHPFSGDLVSRIPEQPKPSAFPSRWRSFTRCGGFVSLNSACSRGPQVLGAIAVF